MDLFAPSYVSELEDLARTYLGEKIMQENDLIYKGDQSGLKMTSPETGLHKMTAPMGANFGDLNNDGFLDYYLGTGSPNFEALMPNVMFLNQKGKSFLDITVSGGFGHLQKGHGIAFADLDNDGDQDIVAEMGGFFIADSFVNAVYENPGFKNNWISIKLEGKYTNKAAIGSRIKLVFKDLKGKQRSVYRWIGSGGSFGSNPLEHHIGIGKAKGIESIEVTWQRTGKKTLFRNLPVNRSIVIKEGIKKPIVFQKKRISFTQKK